MAFIDNPIIASLGSSLGLQPLFAAAGGSPAPADPTADPQQAAPRPAASKPNVPEFRNRPYIPRNENTARGVTPGGGGSNPVMPGPMSQDTLQSPQVQALLGQYGVKPSTQAPDPNLFIHNPQAYQNHPLAAGLLEHGLRGLAYAHPGNNWLDSLIGGVRGIQESNAASAQQVNNQLMAPIQQAQSVAGLQHLSDEHSTALADQHYKEGMLHVYQQNAESKAERAAHFPLQKNPDGTMSRWNPDANNGQGGYEVDPSIGRDEELYQKNQYFQGAAHQLALSKYNGDVTKISPEDIAGIHSNWDTMQSRAKGAASEDNNQRTVAASKYRADHPASGRNGNVKFSPVDADAIKSIEQEGKTLDHAASTPGTIMYDDNNQMLIGGTAKAAAYVAKRKADLDSKKKSITDRYSQPTASPRSGPVPTRNPNPMTQTPSASRDSFFHPLPQN
ncbi:unnamed protein product [Sphagnum jensenii]